MGRSSRRFQVIDAMILVAATAIGIVLARRYDEIVFNLFWKGPGGVFREGPPGLQSSLFAGFYLLTPMVLCWTFAFAILRLRQPRPRLRRLFRQPGMAACVAVLTVPTAFITIDVFGSMLAAKGEFVGQGVGYWLPEVLEESIFWVGCTVAAVWMNLALSRRCARERSWIDRLGCVLAFYWVALPVVRAALLHLP